ncbi:transposase [Salipiger mangrovisoli]|uniref:Transposase n=1 Tax=Salipiger mangrovisoli TaxID=2865933 RepID=A0ABR9X9T2_9RHOB|nr:transposase [Salipiger mangrovisoli]MBE9640369.1 transposase [Salipiger mangrovisoli]
MPRLHRSHRTECKRQIVAKHSGGETRRALGRRHDVSRNLIGAWIEKAEARELDADVAATELMAEYAARIVALERLAGHQALKIAVLKGTQRSGRLPRNGPASGLPTSGALDPVGMATDGRREVRLLWRPPGRCRVPASGHGREFEVQDPDQLWMADLTYTTIARGFLHAAWIRSEEQIEAVQAEAIARPAPASSGDACPLRISSHPSCRPGSRLPSDANSPILRIAPACPA